MVGSKIEAKNFVFNLEFHGIKPNFSSIYTGEVISVDETEESIQDEKRYFGIDFEMFKAQGQK